MSTETQDIPSLSTSLTIKDMFSSWKARWGIGRMKHLVKPGLYKIGNPDETSKVLVTANYKLSVDKLRSQLGTLNLWILVLDTKGINVWCAAGKGTFGTDELISKIRESDLKSIINHNQLILPQLGAVGVRAQAVQKETGFKVKYGPVLAADIPEYLKNGQKKSENMRKVQFPFIDRLILVPIELVKSWPLFIGVLLLALLITFFEGLDPITYAKNLIPFLGAIFTGLFITPILLPFIPFRSFAIKGAVIGVLWVIGIYFFLKLSVLQGIAYLFFLTPISSFLALNFTGASTFTSLSGVKIEVKTATPIFIISMVIGIVLKILDLSNIF